MSTTDEKGILLREVIERCIAVISIRSERDQYLSLFNISYIIGDFRGSLT